MSIDTSASWTNVGEVIRPWRNSLPARLFRQWLLQLRPVHRGLEPAHDPDISRKSSFFQESSIMRHCARVATRRRPDLLRRNKRFLSLLRMSEPRRTRCHPRLMPSAISTHRSAARGFRNRLSPAATTPASRPSPLEPPNQGEHRHGQTAVTRDRERIAGTHCADARR